MATSPAPRWQRLDHDERRRQILACARRLFSERHYAAVSTSEIAREAGVARGLLHHYFGTKRELYLEVVRAAWCGCRRIPSRCRAPGGGVEIVITESVERWLGMLERNRGTWLAAIGARGLGRDPEVEAILDEAREQAVDRLIEALRPRGPLTPRRRCAPSSVPTRASRRPRVVEWLVRERLDCEQIKALLVHGFLSMVRDVLPAVERAGRPDVSAPRTPTDRVAPRAGRPRGAKRTPTDRVGAKRAGRPRRVPEQSEPDRRRRYGT